MPVQYSPPAKNTRSQRHQAVITPTARAPLDRTPSVHQLTANLDRGPPREREAPSRRGGVKSRTSKSFSGLLGGYPSISQGPRSRLGEAEDEEEDSEETEVETALEGAPEASKDPNLAHYNQPLLSQAEPNSCKMMEQMTQFMGQLTQAVAPRDTSKAQEFKTPSMKAPDSFYGTKAYKLRRFIQSFQLIFHNDPENFFCDRKNVLYSTSFLTGRAGKWTEPYLSNISNEGPSYLLNNLQFFETQLFTLFDDPNEVRKAEQELDNLRMRECDSPKVVDLRLGYDFLYHSNPIIDWKYGLITHDSSHKYSSGINFSTSNEFSTAVNNVALVGELKTPFLSPSVHIPFIIPSHSLLPSRDEAFKEIKDFEAFQEDIDCPPLSFHSSLEEQWDEEEEPE
ncbi:hypothetical protein O181_021288 [Austropuccinia psidii MF-1]|uniref:DUF4939 domain-containing protein n=1 Tax=Austropuccinia psidii MF-1 TaxID=1389203 RepID=A0A9Q3CEN6_9BASI|nr:hypothetical protein [Austropuccinia psidii MF-1]